MSLAFLKNLNGQNQGHFSKWLLSFQNKSPKVAWYPSAGKDFRSLLYLNSEYAKNNFQDNEWVSPDIFIHTDYYKPFFNDLFPRNLVDNFTRPTSQFESLMLEFADLSGWHIYNDGKTNIRITKLEILPNFNVSEYDLKWQDDFVTLDIDRNPRRKTYFMMLEVWSDRYGQYTVPLIYINVLNEAFVNRLIEEKATLSHIIHVRYGSGFGGARCDGSYLMNTLTKLDVKYYLSDPFMKYESDRLPGRIYPNLKKGPYENFTLESVHLVNSLSWSCHGNVSFYKVRN